MSSMFLLNLITQSVYLDPEGARFQGAWLCYGLIGEPFIIDLILSCYEFIYGAVVFMVSLDCILYFMCIAYWTAFCNGHFGLSYSLSTALVNRAT